MKSIRISFKALELTLFSYLFTTHHPFLYFRWAVFVIKCARVLSCFSRVQLFATQWIAANLLCPWDSPGKNTGMDCHALLQGIFLTQGLNPHLLCLLRWRVDSLIPGSPTCGILVLQLAIEPRTPAVEAWSPSYWAMREFSTA